MATWLVPLVTGLIGALLVYIPASRRISGRIAYSEAAVLWEEARAMREDYRDTSIRLREQLATCEVNLAEAKAQLDALRHTYQAEIDALRSRVKELENGRGTPNVSI